MTTESVFLDSLIGKVKSYGMDMPASLNDAGEKVIYLTDKDNRTAKLSMALFMKHRLFTTFSQETQLKLNHWCNE